MNEFQVTVYCVFCGDTAEHTIRLPAGWATRYDGTDVENALCPDHAEIKKFTDSQCPGCVGGWGDCGLFEAFAYRELKLTDADFAKMESGICPKRTNGTMMFANGQMSDIDLTDPPDKKAGKALAIAIHAYSEKYHKVPT